MKSKTYSVKGNRTAADVLANREETIGSGLELEQARRVSCAAQTFDGYIAAWIEEEAMVSSSLDTLKFAVIVADAKSKTSNLRWLRAIDRAAEGILSGELIVTTLFDGALVTSPNGSYYSNGSCACKAFKHGHRECRHRAAGRLMELYEEAKGSGVARPLTAPRITRSVNYPSVGAMWFAGVCD